ncbi:MAG: DUF3786 domain-containing protein [Anaerolineales bacterium]|jgi:hypothetical protein|nr:DUF3786 domain-containing protein [Anaerolineales bacterium]
MTDFQKDRKTSRTPTSAEQLAGRVDELRSALRVQDPGLVAVRSGSSYLTLGPGRGELHLLLWDRICILCWPELTGCNEKDDRLPDFQLTMLLYYLLTADGAPLTVKWVSFADLPDGRMYNAAFQGYSGDEIVKRFGLDLEGFKSACSKAGGEPVDVGSASFVFQALPKVPLMLTYWLGDEDFPSSCKVLFDESVSHYLPIDACAILGSTLTGRVIRAKT